MSRQGIYAMKQLDDQFARDEFDRLCRVRPSKPHAKTPAQRQREFRQRQKFNFLNSVNLTEIRGVPVK